MSILIRGMEMPKNCEDCPLFESKYHFHGCHAKPESFNDMNMWNFVGDRPSWCPLIELPPHGDLIDRDRLTDTIDGITWYHQNRNKDIVEGANSAEHQAWYREQDVHEAVADAPVVIESEE